MSLSHISLHPTCLFTHQTSLYTCLFPSRPRYTKTHMSLYTINTAYTCIINIAYTFLHQMYTYRSTHQVEDLAAVYIRSLIDTSLKMTYYYGLIDISLRTTYRYGLILGLFANRHVLRSICGTNIFCVTTHRPVLCSICGSNICCVERPRPVSCSICGTNMYALYIQHLFIVSRDLDLHCLLYTEHIYIVSF